MPQLTPILLINSLAVGGAERAFISQANIMVNHVGSIYFVILNKQNIDPDMKSLLDPRVKVVVFSLRSLLQLHEWCRIILWIRKHHDSVLYATLDHATIVARIVKFFIPSIRVVIRESGMANRKSWRTKLIDRILNYYCDGIIAVSSAVKNSLLSYQPAHVHKITVIENGVTLPPNFLRQRLPGSPVRLFHIGSMNNLNKGQRELIKLFIELINLIPQYNLTLTFIGDGAYRSKFEEQASQTMLRDRINFLGQISPKELDSYYREADIFVFASKSEGSPNVILEAMAYELPVVAIDTPGLLSLIDNGVTGFLIPPGESQLFVEKIVLLVKNESLRMAMGKAAAQHVQTKFSLERTVEKVENILYS